MKVSIIIPTYNVETYIIDCLESITSQTFQGTLECIIVDDCGTDDSIALAESFIQHYQGNINFRILHREKNGGLSAARNSGLNEAKGEYVYFLDSDDYITPDCIENLVNTAERYPQAEMIQAGMVDQNGNVIFDAKDWHNDTFIEKGRYLQENLLLPSRWLVSSCNKLIKREFLTNNNIFFLEGVIHEDVDFIYKIVNCLNYYAVCMDNSYVYRIQRKGSIVNTTNNEKSLASRLKIYDSALRLNRIDKRVLTRSLFHRVLHVMLTFSDKSVLKDDLNQFVYRLIQRAVGIDKIIFRLYFSLPLTLKRKSFIYRIFSKLK